MSIRTKLLLIAIFSMSFLAISIAMVTSKLSTEILVEQKKQTLKAEISTKQRVFTNLLDARKKEIQTLAQSADVIELSQILLQFYTKLPNSDDHRLLDKVAKTLKKHAFKHEEFFRLYLKEHGYYDIFIISKEDGHVLYTSKKESDFCEVLTKSPLIHSGLGKAWKATTQYQSTHITDLSPYPPSKNLPSMFVSTPIFIDGKFEAVLALQFDSQEMTKHLFINTDQSQTKIKYLIGDDFLLRSKLEFDNRVYSVNDHHTNPSLFNFDSKALDDLFQLKQNTIIQTKDFRDINVIKALGLFEYDKSISWAIVSQIDLSEIQNMTFSIIEKIFLLSFAILLLTLLMVRWYIKKDIIEPIEQLHRYLKDFFDFAQHKKSKVEPLPQYSDDEIGKMASMINTNVPITQHRLEMIDRLIERSMEMQTYIQHGRFDFRLDTKNYYGKFLFIVNNINQIMHLIEEKNIEIKKQQEKLSLHNKEAALSKMLSSIAHHWRQPLNMLNINIQNLEEDFEDGVIDQTFLEDFVEKNCALIQSMSRTIDQFRGIFATKDTDEDANICNCLNSAIDLVQKTKPDQKVDITLHPCENSLTVRGPSSELTQVFIYILTNAYEIFEQRECSEKKIDISIQQEGSSIHIYIKDSAGGIDKKVEKTLFDAYSTTKFEKHGTGLSLYITKSIIQNHFFGDITASNDEFGAVFEIILNTDTTGEQNDV